MSIDQISFVLSTEVVEMSKNVTTARFPITVDRFPMRTKLQALIHQSKKQARLGHFPVGRQLLEMAYFWVFKSIGPGFYHAARLYRRELDWKFKNGYYSYAKFRRRVQEVNPVAYQKFSQHKLAEKAILTLLSIPTPRFLGHLHPRDGRTAHGVSLRSVRELDAFLKKQPGGRICFKLVEGWGGTGFQAAELETDGGAATLRQLGSDQKLTVAVFAETYLDFKNGSDYVIEEYLQQDPWYANLNPSSVNTIRVVVLRREQDTILKGAVIRIGGQGALVDNVSAGGTPFKIDVETGELGVGFSHESTDKTKTLTHNPATGERLAGTRLPRWSEIEALAIETIESFPKARYAGLDIAVSMNGPTIIELNLEPDPIMVCDFGCNHEQLFL